jgi:hypothetical protein
MEREGFEIVLVSVELWSEEVVVRLAVPRDTRTQQLEAHYEQALDEWAKRRQQAADEPPPPQPGELLLDVDVQLHDDMGTAYRPRIAARGGSGRMFRGEWFFEPGPPTAATAMTVVLSADTAIHRTVLPLPT